MSGAANPSGLYIVTGHSRGLGAALATGLLQQGHGVLGISRRVPAGPHHPALTSWALDLAEPAHVASRLEAWLTEQAMSGVGSINLINNAGRLSRIGPIDNTSADDLATALRVGLEAPLLLAAAFLRATQATSVPRRVLNISSGLGRRAMAGSAAYCAAKAGLDHFTRCTALDEAGRPNGARIVSLAPGVIDTDMQEELRGSDPTGFPDRDTFVRLRTEGTLASADDTAARVLAFLHRPDFGAQPVADIREL